MPYVGRSTDKISNVEVLDNITFDGSSSYTLQKGGSNFTPSSANTLLLSIDGVVQAGNFTVSGSTIDFGTAVAGTSTCDFVLHYGVGLITSPSDGTVTTAKLADSSVSLAKLTATGTKDATTFLRGDNTFAEVPAGGITVANTFRMTSDLSVTSSSLSTISSNLEVADTSGQGSIGSAITESSGIYSFPSTGIYLVEGVFQCVRNGGSQWIQTTLDVTTNNSSYTKVADAEGSISHVASANTSQSIRNSSLVDVTDTSNVKVRFQIATAQSITLKGNTSYNYTYFNFIRLGDT